MVKYCTFFQIGIAVDSTIKTGVGVFTFEFLFGLICCEFKAAELLCSFNLYFLLVTTGK